MTFQPTNGTSGPSRPTRRRWDHIAAWGEYLPVLRLSVHGRDRASLGTRPLEVRRRNVVRNYPYATLAGLRFESGSSAETLDQMERILDLRELRREHIQFREKGIYRGVGLAAIVEHSALGPKAARGGIDIVLAFESAAMRVEPDGQITLMVGTHSQGQGHETTFAQIAADEFGVHLRM